MPSRRPSPLTRHFDATVCVSCGPRRWRRDDGAGRKPGVGSERSLVCIANRFGESPPALRSCAGESTAVLLAPAGLINRVAGLAPSSRATAAATGTPEEAAVSAATSKAACGA